MEEEEQEKQVEEEQDEGPNHKSSVAAINHSVDRWRGK